VCEREEEREKERQRERERERERERKRKSERKRERKRERERQRETEKGKECLLRMSRSLRWGEVGGWGRVPFSRNLMKPTPHRKWYLTTGRRFH